MRESAGRAELLSPLRQEWVTNQKIGEPRSGGRHCNCLVRSVPRSRLTAVLSEPNSQQAMLLRKTFAPALQIR